MHWKCILPEAETFRSCNYSGCPLKKPQRSWQDVWRDIYVMRAACWYSRLEIPLSHSMSQHTKIQIIIHWVTSRSFIYYSSQRFCASLEWPWERKHRRAHRDSSVEILWFCSRRALATRTSVWTFCTADATTIQSRSCILHVSSRFAQSYHSLAFWGAANLDCGLYWYLLMIESNSSGGVNIVWRGVAHDPRVVWFPTSAANGEEDISSAHSKRQSGISISSIGRLGCLLKES